MTTLRPLWPGIREGWRPTLINQKEGASGACRAPDARLRNGDSPQGDAEPRRVSEQGRKGIGAACGKLLWRGTLGDQQGDKTQDGS